MAATYRHRPRPTAAVVAPARLQLAAHQPAVAVAAVGGGRCGAVEPGGLEQLDRPDVAGDDVDLGAARLHGVSLDHLGTVCRGVLDRALEQLVHQPPAPEPGPDDEADRAPRVTLVEERDGPRAHQAPVGAPRR